MAAIRSMAFRTVQSLVCKPGASKEIGATISKSGKKSALLVTDPGIMKLGLADGTLQGLKDSGIKVDIFQDVEADPSFTIVEAAAEKAKACGAEHIIGFGGGSSMDVAKLVSCLAHPETTQALDDMYGVQMITGGRLPLTCVTTTAGTGSEVTMNSIITTSKPGEEPMKKGVVAWQLLPDEAVLDAELTLGLPARVTADTGVDAMVHAIEAFTTRHKKNQYSDALAKEALMMLSRTIRRVCCEDPRDIEARQTMLLGACLAGVAFNNAPVGAVHALAYPLGSHFHFTHGLSNAVMLPAVIDFNRGDPNGAALYSELAPFISEKLERDGVGGVKRDAARDAEASAAVVQELMQLLLDLSMKTKLSESGITSKDVDLLTREAMKQTRLLPNNVREVTEADINTMYTEAL